MSPSRPIKSHRPHCARRFRLAAAAIVGSLALAALTALAPPSAHAKPKPAAAALTEPRFEKYELPNGLDVILHEDHSLPVVAVNLWYHVGSKNERVRRTGFAHLFEHMMFQGSQHFDEEYLAAIEKMGGDVNGSTEEDRTDYWENVPSNELERVLWMESDRMGFLLSAMTQAKLDNQRDVVKNERRQGLDNEPYAKAEELLLAMLFPQGHPYSWSVIGSMEDLSAASLDDVSEFFKTYYTPNNASLCIAGDFEPKAARALVEKYFASIPPGPAIDRMQAWIPRLDGVKRVEAEDNVTLPRVYMAWHTPAQYTPGDAEMSLLANILDSGKSSRLYQSLVYEQAIAQEVNASQASRELGGVFTIEATAREGHTLDELEAAIDRELRTLLARGVTDAEVAQTKAVFEAGFVRALERIGGFDGRADLLNAYNTYLGDPGRFGWDLARYTSATAKDVTRAARAALDLDRRVILSIVPQGERVAADGGPDRSRPPLAPTSTPAFAPPAIERATLSNGLAVLLVERRDLPLVHADLVFKGGWAGDPAARPGAASLTAELLDEGTTKRTALEISEALKSLGAYLYSGSSADANDVSLNVLKKNLDPALAIFADVVLHPTFPEEELERQRGIYLGQIEQEMKEPFSLASRTFARELYGADHPYGQPPSGSGTEASIRAITRQDLVDYYAANYAPSNAALVIVGDITMVEATARLEKAFASWPAGASARHDVPTPPSLSATRVCIVDKPGAAQSMIVAGHLGVRRSDADYTACLVMNNALGGQSLARLGLNLREDKGYAYGAGSAFGARVGIGRFVMYAPVQTQSTKESIVELVKEMRDVREKRPLTDAELSNSKNNMIRIYPQEFETDFGVAAKLREMVVYDLPADEWTTFVAEVAAIDGATATRAAKAHLDPDALLIVIVGDREKIEPGIRALNLGEIVELSAAR